MKINFFGFNESTTVGEIRKKYANIDNCKELEAVYRDGLRSAIFYIILGGNEPKKPCCVNY